MAVDIKQFRIGSHILVDGKRERIRGLDEDNGLIVRFPAEYVNANDVEPIAITAELLDELGFECIDRGLYWRKGYFKVYHNFLSVYWSHETIRFRHLHELENLYYLIYGTELIK